jgi:hypothetical protein
MKVSGREEGSRAVQQGRAAHGGEPQLEDHPVELCSKLITGGCSSTKLDAAGGSGYALGNPEVGEPCVSVLSRDTDPMPLSSDPGNIPRWRLSEGQTEGADIGQKGFSMSRSETPTTR